MCSILIIILLCTIVSSFSYKKTDAAQALAAQVVQLSREVKTTNHRTDRLELEENKFRGELQRRNDEFEELLKVERQERKQLK